MGYTVPCGVSTPCGDCLLRQWLRDCVFLTDKEKAPVIQTEA